MSQRVWGDEARRPRLPARAEQLLRTELALEDIRVPPVPLARLTVPPSRLGPGARSELERAIGAGHVRADRDSRLRHATGQGYVDLVRLRTGALEAVPDAVVVPAGHDQVRHVLDICARERVAVVPFGGGTSVVGGVAPAGDGFAAVVALDLARLDRLVATDRVSLTATIQPGVTGAAAEAALAAQGLTLGHFPQSFERATIGGFVATRSAGQASTGYGRIADLVERLRVATPAGDLELGRAPASAAGPDLLALLAGSEGALGIVTEATLRVRPAPAARRYEGYALPTFDAGCAALRTLAQSGLAPDVARLSDSAETRLALARAGGAAGAALRGWLALRGRRQACLLVCGWEGAAPAVRWRRRHALRALRRHGAVRLGTGVGEAWRASRFEGPYLRDALLDRGVLVETLETATGWSGLGALRHAVQEAVEAALRGAGVPAYVTCHVSHLYATGASLYFTVLARPPRGEEIALWRRVKSSASAAIADSGATITHHHGVGLEHRDLMIGEIGALGVAVLRAVKSTVDPAGILNPGKLLPPP